MKSQTLVPAGRVGAIYDIVVTAGFATPWTASLILGLSAHIHNAFGLPGAPMPEFESFHLFYVALFGIVVTMWSMVRIIWPVPLLIAADTLGRAAFSSMFIWALVGGHSAVVVPFLVLEVTFLVFQGLGVRKALRADEASRSIARELATA